MVKQRLKVLLDPHQIASIKSLPGIRQAIDIASWREWQSRGFAPPAAPFVKRAAIRRNAIHNGTFVESGTFLGDTAVDASTYSDRVVTVEASNALCVGLRRRFRKYPNIELIEGRSQDVLEATLLSVRGDVTFWLDAHASGGITYADADVTSIASELAAIARSLHRFERVVIMIDDIRGFGHSPRYPQPQFLLDWARTNGLAWTIELDIMCIRRPESLNRSREATEEYSNDGT